MKSAAQQLAEIKPGLPDSAVAALIANYMMESYATPYWFSINHDVRPPKMLACPVHYDWNLKDRVGIKTQDRGRARSWIVDALLFGYTVSREGGKPLTSSLAIARRRAEYAQKPKSKSADLDDDIPF